MHHGSVTVTFAETMGALYGDLVDPDVLEVFGKLDDPSSVHVPGVLRVARRRRVAKLDDQTKRKLTAGLSAVGAGAGGLGLAVGAREVRRSGWKKTPKLTRALVPVEVAGLAGEVSATHILHGDTKRAVRVDKGMRELIAGHRASLQRQSAVHDLTSQQVATHRLQPAATPADRKAGMGNANLISDSGKANVARARGLAGSGAKKAKKAAGRVASAAAAHPAETVVAAGGAALYGHERSKRRQAEGFYKGHEATISGTFSKFDNEKQRAYGWASVTEVDGMPVIDRQGDVISLDDIEEAAYVYVRKSRITGDMHRRTPDDQPHKIGELIESLVFTPEKCEAMGISKSLAGRWWMGVQVDDPQDWEVVKKARTGFSIHGKGFRKATTVDEVMYG